MARRLLGNEHDAKKLRIMNSDGGGRLRDAGMSRTGRNGKMVGYESCV